MKVLVVGSRNWDSVTLLSHVLDLYRPSMDVLIEGECPFGGADIMARDWANDRGIPVDPHPPERISNWAFWKRNHEMLDLLDKDRDGVLFFKKGAVSKGTDGMLELVRDQGLYHVLVQVP